MEGRENAPSLPQTAPHLLEHCQTVALPQRRRKRSRARLADVVMDYSAAANATDTERGQELVKLKGLRHGSEEEDGKRDMTRVFAEQQAVCASFGPSWLLQSFKLQ